MSNTEKLQRRHASESTALGLTTAEGSVSFDKSDRVGKSGQSAASDFPNRSGVSGGRLTATVVYLRNPAHWWVIGLIVLVSLGAFGKGLKYLEESARRQKAERAASANNSNGENQSWLNAVNPFIEPPLPSATPQLSKEYVYAGSRMLAVEDANANAAPPADLAVWRPSNGYWYVLGGVPGSQATSVQWGQNGDQPVQGDYDGDGKTDFSIFRPDQNAHTGTWYIFQTSTNSAVGVAFGSDTDTPAMADYDGDGRTDIALIRPNGTPGYTSWYILRSSDNSFYTVDFGANSDLPAPADYDGDGKADVAVWRDTNKTFYSVNSSNQASQSIVFQQSGNPVSGDYDGDGRADYALRSGGNWIIRNSSSGTIQSAIGWYQAGDVAVPNDYDGDGKVDIAVWRKTDSFPGAYDVGNWYIRQSSLGGQLRQVQWGAPNDIPVPAFYRR